MDLGRVNIYTFERFLEEQQREFIVSNDGVDAFNEQEIVAEESKEASRPSSKTNYTID